jgi:Cu/Ag efflux protein CusF
MKSLGNWKIAASLAAVLCAASAALSQAPASPPKGEVVVSSVEVTATVAKIDHKTRAVTLKADDGQEYTFVAGPDVANLDQVKKGDLVTATYTEALAYEVKKGGTAGAETTNAAAVAPLGSKPAGAVAEVTTVTVKITAIDTKTPAVTFRGPEGHTRTVKVKDPSKLQGVKVGDTVQIAYVEAVGLTVTAASRK